MIRDLCDESLAELVKRLREFAAADENAARFRMVAESRGIGSEP